MTAGQSRKIWLTRHGESQFNMAGRIGGDSGLTARGEEYARLLPDVLESRLPAVSVWELHVLFHLILMLLMKKKTNKLNTNWITNDEK